MSERVYNVMFLCTGNTALHHGRGRFKVPPQVPPDGKLGLEDETWTDKQRIDAMMAHPTRINGRRRLKKPSHQ